MPVVVAIADYENILSYHIGAFLLMGTLLVIYQLLGLKKPLVSTWLLPGGSFSRPQYRIINPPTPKGSEKTKDGKSTIIVKMLDHHRSLTMITVCMAILAVDFPPIFKRSLCKTEELGISLMDVGVALVTLNSGIASNKARPWWPAQNKLTLL